jgi:GST-like protein
VRRYTDEVRRLYSVLDRRLADRDYVAGDYSIADMAIWPWIVPHRNQGQDLDRTPHLKAWFERVGARDAVQKGFALGRDLRGNLAAAGAQAEAARRILFGQREV